MLLSRRSKNEHFWNGKKVDVFTTNYDTLLERAAKQIIDKKYDVVYSCNDLPYSEPPRIIKLHGSFPTEATHLILSEEDYRRYPNDFSPFVNTVQQAIMESTLCLVGFSGTDPNFLKWIGWVKDNLKDSMPPVYLIGLLDLPASEQQVLLKHNIIPVDLSRLKEIKKNEHKKALEKFFRLLNEKPNYVDWTPKYSYEFLSLKENDADDKIKEVITCWKEERETYPNWLVPSWALRSLLVTMTEMWTSNLDYLKKLPPPWDFMGLFELNWRMEKCLMPIWNNLIPSYESILCKYNPFKITDDFCKETQPECLMPPDVMKIQWRILLFALLRWSREESDIERWSRYRSILEKIIEDDIDSRNRLFYEETLFAMSTPDLSQLDNIISRWDKIPHPPEWNAKYASILSELGQPEKAHSLFKLARQ